jgi:hypothetical protein
MKNLSPFLMYSALVLGIGYYCGSAQANNNFELKGLFNANSTERDEGYASVGVGEDAVTIMAKPGSRFHAWALQNLNRNVTLTLETERTTR